ncbi:MAG: SlyX family protein [Pseudohongiellaceae bacterium]
MEKQLIELQTQFSFQEDMIQELNAVVARQQQQIDRLENKMEHYQNQLSELTLSLTEAKEEVEKPPHW